MMTVSQLRARFQSLREYLVSLQLGVPQAIVASNRDEIVSVLLVEQNSRMVLRISRRAYAVVTGTIALSGRSDDQRTDDRVKQL